MSAHGKRAVLAAAMLTLPSCMLVLGIESADVDPTLTAGGTGGAMSSSDAGAELTMDAAMATDAPTRDAASLEATALDGARDAPVEAGPSAVCSTYCEDVTAYCVGTLKQYVNEAQCLKVCALLPEGTLGAADGNSAACRGKYAAKAQYGVGSERDSYCAKAGPGSDGTCGAICDGYCALMVPTCTMAPYAYPSVDACLTSCRALRDNPPYNVTNDTLPDRDDAQCRLFHANSAVMDADEHCEHAMGVTMCDTKQDGGP